MHALSTNNNAWTNVPSPLPRLPHIPVPHLHTHPHRHRHYYHHTYNATLLVGHTRGDCKWCLHVHMCQIHNVLHQCIPHICIWVWSHVHDHNHNRSTYALLMLLLHRGWHRRRYHRYRHNCQHQQWQWGWGRSGDRLPYFPCALTSCIPTTVAATPCGALRCA